MADCKTCEFENVCTMPDFVRNDLKRCKVYQEKTLQSQGDKIRAMSDEELAEFLDGFDAVCGMCIYVGECSQITEGKCREGFLQWLKSEAKE